MGIAWRHYWIAVGVVALTIPLPGYLSTNQRTPLQHPLSELSYEIASWHGSDQKVDDDVRTVLGADDLLLRKYAEGNAAPVGLYVSYFGRQQQGETNHSPQHCLPGAGWQALRQRRVAYPLGDTDATINEILYEKAGRRQLVFYWYRERDRILASEYLVKWYLMWDAVWMHRTDGALVRVSTPVEDSEDAARQHALAFMRLTLPRLNEFFPN